MTSATPDLDRRRQQLLAARDEIDREVALIEAEMLVAATEGLPSGVREFVSLKWAAGAWGLGYEGARLRAMRLEPTGLAVKLKPGGWRISAKALD